MGAGLRGWQMFIDGFGPWRSISVCFLMLSTSFFQRVSVSVFLFSSQLPLNWALQIGNGNTFKKRRRQTLKSNQTISTVQNHLLTVARFPPPPPYFSLPTTFNEKNEKRWSVNAAAMVDSPRVSMTPQRSMFLWKKNSSIESFKKCEKILFSSQIHSHRCHFTPLPFEWCISSRMFEIVIGGVIEVLPEVKNLLLLHI